MKNILMSGGAGIIDGDLSMALISKGYIITALDSISRQKNGEYPAETPPLNFSIKDNVTFIIVSGLNRPKVTKALIRQDILVHQAAETGTGQSICQIEKYVQVNISGTAVLLDILANDRTYKLKKIVNASSRAIYSDGKYGSDDLCIVYFEHSTAATMDTGNFEVKYPETDKPLQLLAKDEPSKIHPSSADGISKQYQEHLIMTVCPTKGRKPIAFRYQNVYGAVQSQSNPYIGKFSIFTKFIKNNIGINIFEDELESRDFSFIGEVVKATIPGIENDKANGKIFNVGTRTPTSVVTFSQTLMKYYTIFTELKISGSYPQGDIRHNFADLTKIKTKLGFAPEFTFINGIKLFRKWVNLQALKADKYEQSINELKEMGLFI